MDMQYIDVPDNTHTLDHLYLPMDGTNTPGVTTFPGKTLALESAKSRVSR